MGRGKAVGDELSMSCEALFRSSPRAAELFFAALLRRLGYGRHCDASGLPLANFGAELLLMIKSFAPEEARAVLREFGEGL